MVLAVCRQVLGDDHESHDAAQAVFLVLAKKASRDHRNRTSIAPWLHAVACRVAASPPADAATSPGSRRPRLIAFRPQNPAEASPTSIDYEALHEEVARLPEKYRTPVVLCYLEGQTYEEVARSLGCPVGTVRVRLSRARDRLRDRLTRRGFGPAALVPVARCDTLPSLWVESTLRAARLFLTGRATESGTLSTSALALSQGVLWSMTLTNLKLAALALLATGPSSPPAGPPSSDRTREPTPKDAAPLDRVERG